MEEKKKLLSIRDLVVKFHVRGRVLTAIRGISLDIYENESIAIVGESGSGKSVFTKTFAGMLDGNGFIDQGTIKFYDDSLSRTVVRVGEKEKENVGRYVLKLNEASVYEAGADIYREMQELKQERKNKGRLSEEEYQKYLEKTEDLQFQRTEKYNYRLTLDPKKQKDEISQIEAEIKKFDEKLKASENEYKKAVKERINALKEDTAYLQSYETKMAELKEKYSAAVKDVKISEDTKLRNFLLAKEMVLSVERFPVFTRRKRAKAILKGLKNAMKEGVNLSDESERDRIYRDITFRVAYRDQVVNQIDPESISPEELEKKTEYCLKKLSAWFAQEKISEFDISALANEIARINARPDYVLEKLADAKDGGVDILNPSLRKNVYQSAANLTSYVGFAETDLARMNYAGDWMLVRGERIATVFQDPMTSLNPIITIGKQITSVIIKHQHCSEAEARKRALILMKKVGIPNAEKRFDDYPFQYSGGMRQRIVIAIALSCQPKILICDEPTTALDVTIQAQILKLIKDLQKEFGYTIVFITHDLGVVANVADRVAVLYAGQIVELGKVEEVFYDPRHPYTWALLSSLPQLAQRNTKLFSIQGTPPSLYNKIIGDPFAPRNQYCMKIDTLKEPPYFSVSDTHIAKTWLLDPRSPKVDKPEAICDIHEKLKNAFNI
ncbi:MAG: ATP-binding cassette domain-containing protein [Lachnospiraceae bacterium]|nr:ATP-binding cassette domain-containing protein [Lachnospiraceae bacterium]